MSGNITTEAVRAALSMHEMQARIASINIANAGKPEARALRTDFAQMQAALTDAARVDSQATDIEATAQRLQQAQADMRARAPDLGTETTTADEQIGDMVAASTNYQSLTEALSRHFGLMRMAISGRS